MTFRFLVSLLLLISLGSVSAKTSSPEKSVMDFLNLVNEKNYAKASEYLESEPLQSEKTIRRLGYVLNYLGESRFRDISLADEKEKTPKEAQERKIILTQLEVGGKIANLEMIFIPEKGHWVFNDETILLTDKLFDRYGPGPLKALFPAESFNRKFFYLQQWQWFSILILLPFAIVLAWITLKIFTAVVRSNRVFLRAEKLRDFFQLTRKPAIFFITSAFLKFAIPLLRLPLPADQATEILLSIFLISSFFWLLLRVIDFGTNILQANLDERYTDPLQSSGVKTQIIVMRRVVKITVFIVGLSLVLAQFPVMKQLGVSLLASAGIAGVLIGFAAQKTLGSILAGIQLGITMPVRIGDRIVFDGNVGTVEEIHLTFVVILLWDQRRLVVPMQKMLDEVLENWTRSNPQLLATVFLYADYKVPLEKLRAHFMKILQKNPHWDRTESAMVVSDVTDRVVELRFQATAPNTDEYWNLRNTLREQLVAFLATLNGGKYLARERVEGENSEGLVFPTARRTTQKQNKGQP